MTRVSDEMLGGIARALLPTEAEQSYLRLLMVPHNGIEQKERRSLRWMRDTEDSAYT
ncbi:hypothetical protein ABZ942_17655 [Nocardia sp. NPDC046473]|uniref:hypothetical protein n=1 Tax=Nocardia sp. NPDC046473 TaxID=3155733 RepID=UPI00340E3D34